MVAAGLGAAGSVGFPAAARRAAAPAALAQHPGAPAAADDQPPAAPAAPAPAARQRLTPVVRRRVPLGTDEKLFRAMHRRMLDGPRPVPPWARLDPAGVPDALRERVRRGWAARVEAEYRSMVVFGELIARFPEAGLPLEVSCAASRLLQDEARHTELCARVAEAFGVKAWRVVDPEDLEAAVAAAVAHGGPTLVDVIAQPLEESAVPVSQWMG